MVLPAPVGYVYGQLCAECDGGGGEEECDAVYAEEGYVYVHPVRLFYMMKICEKEILTR